MTYRNRPDNTQQTHTVSVYLVSTGPMLHVFGLAIGN